MGVYDGVAEKLLGRLKMHRFSGSLLTLGRQRILITPRKWEFMLARHPLAKSVPVETHYHKRWKTEYISDQTFFKTLGFDCVESVDVSDYEDVTYKADLNRIQPYSSRWTNGFDWVMDVSSIEHIFNLPAVLTNIHLFLKPGAKVMHISPSNGFQDDGFYQLSPTFFKDYYEENNYKIHELVLDYARFDTTTNRLGAVTHVSWHREMLYRPDPEKPMPSGMVSPRGHLGRCQVICVAEKLPASTGGRMPAQSRYKDKDYWRAGL